ncbi:unnamed protein product [Blepharisma stoltei]|uniref:JAB1/MPN/MOV34 metalloenzyme domain-containing protein n=1 Tax=Blepharisma stoltei TaxID=1481888 RepID=A0AAU9JAG6_9CILI|nr:unnamed protein product [Blepharisma stoltei]
MQETHKPIFTFIPKVQIHPSALANIAYYMVQYSDLHQPKLGILMGHEINDVFKIDISFEAIYSNNPEGKEIDYKKTEEKISGISRAIPDCDIVGLYLDHVPSQNEMEVFYKLNITINYALFLVWKSCVTDDFEAENNPIDIYGEFTRNYLAELIKVPYEIYGSLSKSLNTPLKRENQSEEVLPNIYVDAINDLGAKLSSILNETDHNFIFQAEHNLNLKLNEPDLTVSVISQDELIESTSKNIPNLTLSADTDLIKIKTLKNLQNLDNLKLSIKELDLSESEFYTTNSKIINNCLKKTVNVIIEKETSLNPTQTINKQMSIEIF